MSLRHLTAFTCLLASTAFPALSAPGDGGPRWSAETLSVVSDFADKNCLSPGTTGSESSRSGAAELKFSLPALLKKLTDIGATIKGEAKSSDYTGVTQDKLTDALKNAMDCRTNLIALVFDRVLSPATASATDSIEIVEASMKRRGNDFPGYDP